MRPTYSRMLAEHAEIEEAAVQLLEDLAAINRTSSSGLYTRLSVLAALVEQHVLGEEVILADVSCMQLSAPWITMWEEVAKDFELLKTGWLTFIDHWQQSVIEANKHEFRLSVRAMLRGLRERLAWETSGFYATALQAGAVVLRR